MSEERDRDGIRVSQVLAGALAAVTAALVGSTMGVAGTIVGAGLASIVSTVGGALYLKSIQRTSESVRTVRAKVVGRSGDSTVLVSDDRAEGAEPEPGAEVEASVAEEEAPAEQTTESPPARRRLRWPMIVVGSLAAFALGMLAVTGIEWLRGESLSGGSGTTFGGLVERHGGGQETRPPSAPPATSTEQPAAEEPETTTTTTTPPPSPAGTTAPPTTTTTTTEPPETTTTTTEPDPPSGTLPPAE